MIYFNGVTVAHFTTERNGDFGLNWTVPAGTNVGTYTLVARTSFASASVPLEVAAAQPKPAPSDADVSVTVDDLASISVSQLEIGVTHTQYSLDPWGDAEAVARGREVLSTTTNFQNQHIMGWGASGVNPCYRTAAKVGFSTFAASNSAGGRYPRLECSRLALYTSAIK